MSYPLTLSHAYEGRLPLRWIALLRGRLEAWLAATTGVHHGADTLKMIAAGADIVQIASRLISGRPEALIRIEDEMQEWLEARHLSLEAFRGSMSQASCPDPSGYERAGYVRTILSHE